jgi:hypothetical protein
VDRRKFVKILGRIGLGGLLTFLGLKLGEKSVNTVNTSGGGEKCIDSGICLECAVFDNCSLPQAVLAREYLQDKRK